MQVRYLILSIILSTHGIDETIASFALARVQDLTCCNNAQSGISDKRLLRGKEERVMLPLEKIESYAGRLTEENLQKFLDEREPEFDVFKHMGLEDVEPKNLHLHPGFKRWIKYVNDLKRQESHEDVVVSAIPTLLYVLGDRELCKLLDAAATSSDSELKSLARRLKAELKEVWIEFTEKESRRVFYAYGLTAEGVGNIFLNPKFLEWVDYVEDFNKYHVKDREEMVVTLTKMFSVQDLFKQIDEAKNVERLDAKKFQRVAIKIEDELIDHLVTTEDVDDTLSSLGLGWNPGDLSSSPHVNTCLKIVDKHMKSPPTPTQKLGIIQAITARFGDKDIATAIVAAKSDTDMEPIANELESALQELWLLLMYTPKIVYKRLELSESENDFASKILLQTWKRYEAYYYKKNAESLDEFLSGKPLNQEIPEHEV